MASVRLYLDQPDRGQVFRFVGRGGVRGAIPAIRLMVRVNLLHAVRPGPDAGKAAFPDCVIDTGAHLTTVPGWLARYLKPGFVTPLPFDPAMPLHHRRVAIAGGTYPYDLGQIVLPLEDPNGGKLTVTVVAKFTRDGGALNLPLILGLRGGVIDGRTLTATPDPAAPFGQAWALADP